MQKNIVRWFGLKHPKYAGLLSGYPAGVNLNTTSRIRVKAMGMVSGMPDLHLMVPKYVTLEDKKTFCAGLFIELKTANGKLSNIQKKYHEKLRSVGYLVFVSRSFEEVCWLINTYLEEDKSD